MAIVALVWAGNLSPAYAQNAEATSRAIRDLESINPQTRANAIRQLQSQGFNATSQAAKPLAKAAADKTLPVDTRLAALQALSGLKQNGKLAAQDLRRLAQDRDPQIAQAARNSLTAIGLPYEESKTAKVRPITGQGTNANSALTNPAVRKSLNLPEVAPASPESPASDAKPPSGAAPSSPKAAAPRPKKDSVSSHVGSLVMPTENIDEKALKKRNAAEKERWRKYYIEKDAYDKAIAQGKTADSASNALQRASKKSSPEVDPAILFQNNSGPMYGSASAVQK